MRRLPLVLISSLSCLLLGLGLLTGPASAGKPRPDLVVKKGSVAQSGASVSIALSVKNKGRTRAKGSAATVTVGGTPLTTQPVPKVRPGRSRTVTLTAAVPPGLPAGTHVVRACADAGGTIKERSESNNCREIGSVTIAATATSSVPTAPFAFTAGTPFPVNAGAGYWAYVPTTYDASHRTPTKLLVWMHGCGGEAEGDTYVVSPGGAQDWISISLGGRDGACWDVDADPALVLAALADVKTHFNIDPRRVVIGGYSSGGDLAYRTAFYNAKLFAGLVAENTSPFRDTGSSAAQSIAAASWRFNVVHLLHTGDDTYPAAGVRSEIATMTAAGFPVTKVEQPGEHYDANTDADVRTYLLPALGAGWLAPSP